MVRWEGLCSVQPRRSCLWGDQGVSPSPSLPPSLSLSSLYFYSLKLECEKLATEKTEIQRHYVMVSELHLKGGGRRGVSFLNHQRTHSPGTLWLPLAFGLCGQVLRSGSCGCYCLFFPRNEPWCLSRACCRSLWWRSRSRAGCLFSHRQRVGALGGPCPFCGLWPCAGETSAPGRAAGDRVLRLAWPQHGRLWPG